MKIYRLGNRMRAEWDNENEIRISNLEKRNLTYMRPKDWVGKPKECATGDHMDMATYPFFAYMGSDFNVERVPGTEGVEKEVIDGHPTKAENYTATRKEGGPLVAKITLWRAEDLKGFPVRMEIDPPATRKFTLYYTHVSLEPPDPKLFQVPANCLKVTAKPTSGKSKTLTPMMSKPTEKNPPPQQ